MIVVCVVLIENVLFNYVWINDGDCLLFMFNEGKIKLLRKLF